jgi:hypothetical protein
VKPLFQLLFLLSLHTCIYAQEKRIETDSLSYAHIPDSIIIQWQKVDSIYAGFNAKAQDIQSEYQKAITTIEHDKLTVNQEIDSLNKLTLASTHLTRRLDSLEAKRTEAVKTINKKTTNLKDRTIGNLDKVELTPEMQPPVNALKAKVNLVKLGNSPVTIPAVDGAGLDIPDANPLKTLDGLRLETPLPDDLDLNADVTKLANGDITEIENLSTIEQQAANIEGVKDLEESSGVINQVNDMAKPDQFIEATQTQATNQFVGKEKVLQSAIGKLAEYKKHYSNVASVRSLAKRPSNAMKDKPFIERVVPGVYFQYQRKNAYLLDVNLYAAYRISGRFSTALGWNQRFIHKRDLQHNTGPFRIFGPRASIEGKIGRGFSLHFETEVMNTFVPFKLIRVGDGGKYHWVCSSMLGLKKEYKIYGNLRGTALIQYNLFNRYFKTPYVDRVNSRIGFEYILNNKTKEKKK